MLQYLAHHGGRDVGTFTWIGGACHIYDSHLDMANRIVGEDDLNDIKTGGETSLYLHPVIYDDYIWIDGDEIVVHFGSQGAKGYRFSLADPNYEDKIWTLIKGRLGKNG